MLYFHFDDKNYLLSYARTVSAPIKNYFRKVFQIFFPFFFLFLWHFLLNCKQIVHLQLSVKMSKMLDTFFSPSVTNNISSFKRFHLNLTTGKLQLLKISWNFFYCCIVPLNHCNLAAFESGRLKFKFWSEKMEKMKRKTFTQLAPELRTGNRKCWNEIFHWKINNLVSTFKLDKENKIIPKIETLSIQIKMEILCQRTKKFKCKKIFFKVIEVKHILLIK